MRFLHVSDLHVGKRVNGFSMLEDQRHVLGQIVGMLGEKDADALVIAGDVYDKVTPSAEATALVDDFLCAAAATGKPVVMTAGNHDSAERVAYASRLLERQGIHISPVFDGTVRPVVLEDAFGPVAFWPIPFLRPADVRRSYPDAAIESYTDALRTVVDACGVDASARNVAVAHQWVTYDGASPDQGGSESVVGGVDNVNGHVFDAFDYVALGHVHRPQRVGRHAMRYSGSPLKYSFSEIPFAKTVPVVDLAAKGSPVTLTLEPLEPLHDMRTLRGPFASLTSAEALAQGDPQDYLQVILTDEEPPVDALVRLRATYPNIMALSVDNARTRAAGDVGTDVADVGEKTPLELFEEFFARSAGTPMTEEERAVATAAMQKAQVM